MTALAALGTVHCGRAPAKAPDFSVVSRVDSGRAVAVMLTSYSTTLRADGQDWTRLRIAITDSLGREIISARDSIRVYLTGDGALTSPGGEDSRKCSTIPAASGTLRSAWSMECVSSASEPEPRPAG